MAEKKFIIEVRTKGFSKATRDFDKLKNSGSNFNKTQDRMRGSSDGFRGSLGALRNQILVYTFAIGGAVGAMNKFISASQGFQDVKTRLVGLTGSVEAAEQAFQTFNQIASTTPFALQDVVNAGAQLEAFGVDSEATLSSVTDLAAYMGTTATEAANSLGRAFAGGAGSADILREKGILQLIKDSQGIADLSKTTLPEFRQALLNSLIDPAARIAGSADRMSETYTGAVSNMRDAMTQFSAQLGDLILPQLTSMAKSIEEIFREANIQRVLQFGSSLLLVAGGLLIIAKRAAIAKAVLGGFAGAIDAILATALVVLFDKIAQATGAFSDFASVSKEVEESVKTQKEIMEEYIGTISTADKKIDAMQKRVSEFKKDNDQLTESYRDQVAAILAQIKAMEGGTLVEQEEIKISRELTGEQRVAVEQIEILSQKLQELKDKRDQDNEAKKQAIALQEKLAKEQQERELQLLDDQIARLENAAMARAGMIDQNLDLNDDLVDSNRNVAASILGIAGALKTMTDAGATAEQRFSTLLSTIGGILMMIPGQQIPGALLQAGSMFIGHTGGLIKDNGIQRFAQGGMVQGRDNVPILAQSGEFIMQRSAVQNIGVDQLAQMNSTGQSNGVTINIQGNMIGNESFVRDTLIPEISKAQNQGLA